jgi:hypothetical protein
MYVFGMEGVVIPNLFVVLDSLTWVVNVVYI